MLSIVTPVLNGENFIQENIESIMSLEIPYEHIIVDGGSSDSTLDIIQKYSHLIILHQEDKKGMYSAIHQGFRFAKGEFIAYINCDDILVKAGFESMYNKLISSGADMIYSNAIQHFKQTGRKQMVKSRRFGKYFLKNGLLPFVQPSSVYSKNVYFKVGGFRYDTFKICGDLDLFQRIALEADSKILHIRELSSIFLKYGESLGDLNNSKYEKEKLNLKINLNVLNRILFKIAQL